MWRPLILLALWLGTVGVGRAELTATQHQGLQLALEEFHKHPRVQWAFQKTSMDSATETGRTPRRQHIPRKHVQTHLASFPAGTFVRLEFKLQQTSCGKKDWRKAECKVKSNGRKRKCLVCIKLDRESKVLGRMVHCPIETQAEREPTEHEEAKCSNVERSGEDPQSYRFPGQYAFLRAGA